MSRRVPKKTTSGSSTNLSVGVVIPCHNNSRQLNAVLKSLAYQSAKADAVIVVDDNSDPAEAVRLRRLCRGFGATYEPLPAPRNKWEAFGRRSHARNAGTRLLDTELILYLDGDMLLSPGYLEEVRSYHAALPRAYIRGVRYSIPIEEQNQEIENCLRDFLMKFRASAPSPGSYTTADDRLLVASSEPVRYDRWEWCASNNVSLRRRYAIEIGGWDQNFFGWGEEDIDFSFRLFQHGLTPILLMSENASCYHLDHYIDHDANLFTLRRNAALLMRKWPEIAEYRREAYAQYHIDVDDLLENSA